MIIEAVPAQTYVQKRDEVGHVLDVCVVSEEEDGASLPDD